MFYVFFITGDLKDCCSYVNRSYCETSVFTVNVIWLLLLYSCFYHALQHWFHSFFFLPIWLGPFVIVKEEIYYLISLKTLISWSLIGQNLLFQIACYGEKHYFVILLIFINAGLRYLLIKHNTVWAAGSFFHDGLLIHFILKTMFLVTIINDWLTRVSLSVFLSKCNCTICDYTNKKSDAYSGTLLVCCRNHVQVPRVKHSSLENLRIILSLLLH